jgi:PilZ domain-containing protein
VTTIENRKRPRVAVGGNVEIVSVSSGAPPEGRASILNCSRSGALFRLDAPRGGLFRRGKATNLSVQDSLSCVLRMPPHYQNIELLAEVVRVEQPSDDPKGLHVGVRFFLPEAPLRTDPNVATLRRVLGKAGISAEEASLAESPTAESRRKSRRVSGRAKSSRQEARRPSRRTRRLPEMNAELTPSKRSRRATSSGTGEVKRKRSARSDSYSEPKRSSRREGKRSQRFEEPDLSAEFESAELESEILDSASHVAEALKSDLFREESWSNYLLGASLEDDDAPKAKVSLDADGRSATIQRRSAKAKAKPKPTPAPAPAPLAAPASAPVVYTSLGGPENGLYVRGSAILSQGEARVRLPEHFTGLIDEHTLTVQITARGACHGLYVARATGRGLLVRELAEGRSDAPFDYLVLAERRR